MFIGKIAEVEGVLLDLLKVIIKEFSDLTSRFRQDVVASPITNTVTS